MDKSPDAFRTISEVAAELDLPQHVLRFWETRFSQIKPLKRGGGRRYYRPDDVDLLCGIRQLLYGEGYTIKGVQRLLKENGVHWAIDVGRGLEAGGPGGGDGADAGKAEPPVARAAAEPRAASGRAEPRMEAARPVPEKASSPTPPAPPARVVPVEEAEPLPRDVLADDVAEAPRSGLRLIDRLRGEPRLEGGGGPPIAKDDIRRLQATLFELLECKRILDQAR